MAKKQGTNPSAIRSRAAKTAAAMAAPSAAAHAPPKKPFNPVQFFREVRAEARKVTWTSWKETWITSVMVGDHGGRDAMLFFFVRRRRRAASAIDSILKLAAGG